MNHRTIVLVAVSLTGISVASILADVACADRRPHILYINADDLGVMDVGYNDPAFRTPNIDRLAKEGMTFRNAYAPASNCAPSRACVHSGQWGPRHGVYTVGNSDRGRAESRKLIPIKNRETLPGKQVTLAESLKAGGYKTIHLGKYHIGKDPLQEGFDVNIGGDASGSPGGGYYSPWKKGSMKPYTSEVERNTHRVDVFAREAVEFIEANHGEPMFVHFSPYLVHSPLTSVPEFLDNYQGSHLNAAYASMVEKLDKAIGIVLDSLDRIGIKQSTLVVFSSDNGGIAAIHSQDPYRGGKGSYYEGGIREPMIVRWPGKVAAATVCKEVVSTMDLYPTFLQAAGLKAPPSVQLDGQSLLPLLTKTGTWQPVAQFWHFPVYLQAYQGKKDDARDRLFRTRPGAAMRDGHWKLHEYFEDGAIELYDLDQDPGERVNLAEAMPGKAKHLHDKMLAWRERVGAPVPTEPNPQFDAALEQKWLQKVDDER